MTQDVDALLARLEAKRNWTQHKPYWHENNPDGLEAAALIRKQAAEIERLKIEMYGVPASKNATAISIFDLPKAPDQ